MSELEVALAPPGFRKQFKDWTFKDKHLVYLGKQQQQLQQLMTVAPLQLTNTTSKAHVPTTLDLCEALH